MHTRSVYLMPWSDQAEIAAFEVTKAGQAFLWTSTAKTKEKQRELTTFYDKEIDERLNEIKDRIKRIKKHQENDEERPANRMFRKTGELLEEISNTVANRSSITILNKIVRLYKELMEVGNGKNKED